MEYQARVRGSKNTRKLTLSVYAPSAEEAEQQLRRDGYELLGPLERRDNRPFFRRSLPDDIEGIVPTKFRPGSPDFVQAYDVNAMLPSQIR
jgi:hypothetical protein